MKATYRTASSATARMSRLSRPRREHEAERNLEIRWCERHILGVLKDTLSRLGQERHSRSINADPVGDVVLNRALNSVTRMVASSIEQVEVDIQQAEGRAWRLAASGPTRTGLVRR